MNVMSWNIKQFNFNPSKEEDGQFARLHQIKEIVESRSIDILVVLEVRPSVKQVQFDQGYNDSQGALVVAQLAQLLGDEWQVAFSGGNAVKEQNKGELYAFMWRSSRVQAYGQPTLVYQDTTQSTLAFKNRVPCVMPFARVGVTNPTPFVVMVYHAPNPSEMDVKEIGYIKIVASLIGFPLILCGDFNMDTGIVKTALQPDLALACSNDTSLRVQPYGSDNPYDAIFYRDLELLSAGGDNTLVTVETTWGMTLDKSEISSVKRFSSDHAPVWAQFNL
ncbi:hypothetical protein GCM10027093_02710 [Paraburkholderia jirisanensis]